MRVIDDLDAHLDALHGGGRGPRRPASIAARRPRRRARYVVDVCRRHGRDARREVEVDGDRGDRPQRGARGGGRRGRSRPTSASTSSSSPASTRCTSSRRRSRRPPEDVAELLSRVEGKPVPAELDGADAGRAAPAARDVPRRRRRHHRRQLRRRRDRLDRPRHERGQRAARQRAAARARRAHGHGAARRRRSPTSPCCSACSRAAAPGSSSRAYTTLITGPRRDRASRTGPRSCTS